MKKGLRVFISLLVVCCFIVGIAGCGGAAGSSQETKEAVKQDAATEAPKQEAAKETSKEKAKPAEPVKLTVWINGRDSYIGPDEQKKPQEEWYISKAFKRFEAANPGITVELTVPPDQAEAHQTFKAAGMAKNAPDIANLWTGQNIFNLKEVIKPLDGLVPKEDLDNLLGWDSVREGFKKDGKILGYPAGDVQLCFFLYNKKIIKAAGLDFEANPPRTVKDFDEACEKIKKMGATPIVVDESFPYFYCYLGVYWWVQATGIDGILKDCAGTSKFVNDKGFIDSLSYYNSLYKKGYVNKDALTSADSWNQFLQAKAAMTPQVTSVVNDAVNAMGSDNLGVIKPPEIGDNVSIKDSTIGGPGQCLVVSSNCQHPEAAVKLLSFINSKAEVLEFEKVQSKIPLRKDITLDELGWKEGSIPHKLYGWAKNYTYWVDNSLTPNVQEDFYKQTPLTLVGKMTPQALAELLDKKVEKGSK